MSYFISDYEFMIPFVSQRGRSRIEGKQLLCEISLSPLCRSDATRCINNACHERITLAPEAHLSVCFKGSIPKRVPTDSGTGTCQVLLPPRLLPPASSCAEASLEVAATVTWHLQNEGPPQLPGP